MNYVEIVWGGTQVTDETKQKKDLNLYTRETKND